MMRKKQKERFARSILLRLTRANLSNGVDDPVAPFRVAIPGGKKGNK